MIRVQPGQTELPPAVHQPRQQRRRGWKRYSSRTFYLFILPWLAGFLGLTLIPLIYALLVSFTNFDGISPHWHWVGLSNYRELLRNTDTWYSLGRTLFFTVLAVPLNVAGGLGLAMLLNERVKAVGVLRTIFYVPSIVPVVASAIMWRLIFDRDVGVLNAVLERLRIPVITWLVDPTVFYALLIMILWGLGGGMVISLAALQGIPQELEEAAMVDVPTAGRSFAGSHFLYFRLCFFSRSSPVASLPCRSLYNRSCLPETAAASRVWEAVFLVETFFT